jgi:hypothetical protein
MQYEMPSSSTNKSITVMSAQLQKTQGMTARDLLPFAGIGVVIVVAVLGLTLIGRALGWWDRHTSAALFRDLCKAHQLDRGERALLSALVRAHKLGDPTLIFVQPERLHEESVPKKLQHKVVEIAKLRVQIFGSAA